MFVRPAPDPENVPPETVPETVKELKVPTDVMFGCAFRYTDPATYAVPTVPDTFEPFREDKADPDPINEAAETAPVTAVTRWTHAVMFGCAG
jgi:hypothetical protein